ncbi:hypothetical protein TFLX_05435 [Thermoflexales bacterium]|nr:hypothetical protein TFLX_05435 [Thermoflexales bacterium]
MLRGSHKVANLSCRFADKASAPPPHGSGALNTFMKVLRNPSFPRTRESSGCELDIRVRGCDVLRRHFAKFTGLHLVLRQLDLARPVSARLPKSCEPLVRRRLRKSATPTLSLTPRFARSISRERGRSQQQAFGDGGLIFELGAGELFVFRQPFEQRPGGFIAFGGGFGHGGQRGRLRLIGVLPSFELGGEVGELGGGNALPGEPVGVGRVPALLDEGGGRREEVLLIGRFATVEALGLHARRHLARRPIGPGRAVGCRPCAR